MAFDMETGIGGVAAVAYGGLLRQADQYLQPGTPLGIQLTAPALVWSAGAVGEALLGRLAPAGLATMAPAGIAQGAYVSASTTIGWILSRRYIR